MDTGQWCTTGAHGQSLVEGVDGDVPIASLPASANSARVDQSPLGYSGPWNSLDDCDAKVIEDGINDRRPTTSSSSKVPHQTLQTSAAAQPAAHANDIAVTTTVNQHTWDAWHNWRLDDDLDDEDAQYDCRSGYYYQPRTYDLHATAPSRIRQVRPERPRGGLSVRFYSSAPTTAELMRKDPMQEQFDARERYDTWGDKPPSQQIFNPTEPTQYEQYVSQSRRSYVIARNMAIDLAEGLGEISDEQDPETTELEIPRGRVGSDWMGVPRTHRNDVRRRPLLKEGSFALRFTGADDGLASYGRRSFCWSRDSTAWWRCQASETLNAWFEMDESVADCK